VILVFTDGADNPANLRDTNNTLRSVMKRAEEEDVMVYAVGLVGQNPKPGYGSSGFGGPGGGRGGMGRGGLGRGGYGRGGSGGRVPFDDKPDEGLPKIAAATGGSYFALTSTVDLASTFTRVADELHHQYALGFSPAALDGKRHTLDVRLSAAGLSARARKSYVAGTD
jgi:VWFA-related protein